MVVEFDIHPLDYVIFALFILISFAIGIYYAYKNRNVPTEDEYFLGNRQINVFAAACSAASSAFAGANAIGVPNDSYFRGPGIWFAIFTVNIFEGITLPLVFVPIFYRLKLTNVYDYLQLRFNVYVKYYAASVQVIYTMFYMGLQIYAPSLALSIVTGLSVNWSILLLGGVCVIYTTVGGMKAVVWNDVFQTVVIMAGTGIMLALGIPAEGGWNHVAEVAGEGQRTLAIDFSFDLTKPYTFFSSVVAIPLIGLSRGAVGQYNAQRFLVVKNIREARFTASFGQLFSMFFTVCYVYAGMLMYVHFVKCDPYSNGDVEKTDQVFPLWFADIFSQYPGIVGLMVSAAFSSALSTVSSGINAQAVMTHKEVGKVLPFTKSGTPEQNIRYTKILTFILGCLILLVSFLAGYIGGIVDAVITWAGILTVPILAVFILGMVSKRANSTAALVGMIASTLIGVWLKIGNQNYPRSPSALPPLSTDQCNATESMMMMMEEEDMSALVTEEPAESIPPSIYQLSSVYYGLVTCLLTWFLAFVITVITHLLERVTDKVAWINDANDKQDEKLFLSHKDLLCCCTKSDDKETDNEMKKWITRTVRLNQFNAQIR